MYPGTGINFWNSYIIKSFARVLDVSAETSSRPMLVSKNKLQLDTLFSDTFLAEQGQSVVNKKFVYFVFLEGQGANGCWRRAENISNHYKGVGRRGQATRNYSLSPPDKICLPAKLFFWKYSPPN